MQRSKRYQEASKKFDTTFLYEPEEAFKLVKEIASARFDETVEVAIRLGVDPKHADQQVRGALVLPNGTGKEKKVLVFAKGEKIKEAEDANADYVGGEDLVKKIEDGWLGFDVAIATPDMMKFVGKLGRVLGPRGMMPNPKTGTVTFDVAKAVQEFKAGKVEYRTDKSGIIHLPVGKASFVVKKLLENFYAIIDTLIKVKPAAAKGQYLRTITISSCMGPGIKINSQKVISLGK